LLTLQLKWARLYGASPAMTREEMVRCHTAELDELAETFVLAYADYLAQRLSAPEQER
jgi:hypothetical protein